MSLALVLDTVPKFGRHFGANDAGSHDIDEYLWAPGLEANVKLRRGDLKFKRRIELTTDGCEHWMERSEENFRFPLSDEAVAFVEKHIPVRPPGRGEFRRSPEAFVAALSSFTPPLHLVRIRKHRMQFDVPRPEELLLFELSQIEEPVRMWSVAIEGFDLGEGSSLDPKRQASLQRVRALRDYLELPGSLTVTGYLDLLGQWVRSPSR